MENSFPGSGSARLFSLILLSTVGALGGRLDPAFDPGVGPNGPIRSVLPLPDGRILVVGDFSQWGSTAAHHLVRLESNGALDTTYSGPTEPAFQPHQLWLADDGKILVGGDLNLAGGAQRGLVRLMTDGSLDESFHARLDAEPAEVVVLPNGLIGVAGEFTKVSDLKVPGLARLVSNGTPDPDFHFPGTDVTGHARSLVALTDGSWLVSGLSAASVNSGLVGLLRFHSDGSLDPEYRLDGGGLSDGVFSRTLSLFPDGGVLLDSTFEVRRLTSEGYLDPTFEPKGIAGTAPDFVFALPNGSILARSSVGVTVGGQSRGLVRLQANGQLDTTFNLELGRNPAAGIIVPTAVGATALGEIYLAGNFDSVEGQPRPGLARLLSHDPSAPPTLQWSADQITSVRRLGPLTLTVLREGDLSQPARVDYTTRNGMAQGGQDFKATNGTIRFGVGENFRLLKLETLAPDSVLGDRQFSVVLTNALALTDTVTFSNLVSDVVLVTVTNQVTFTNFVTLTNEIALTNQVVVTNEITLTPQIISTNEVTFTNVVTVIDQVAMTNVVALTNLVTITNLVAFTNVVTLTNTVAFTNVVVLTNSVALTNQLAFTNIVTVTNVVATTNEVASVNAAVAALGSVTEIGVHLLEERSTVEFSISALSVAEPIGVMGLGFRRTNGLGVPAAVTWRVTNNVGQDFAPTQGIVVFGTGEATAIIPLVIHDNAVAEGNRTYLLELASNGFRATPSGLTNTAITIVDNDDPGFGGDGFNAPIAQFLPVGSNQTLVLGGFLTVHGTAQANAAWLRNDGRIADFARPPAGPIDGPTLRLFGALAPSGGYFLAGQLGGTKEVPEQVAKFLADGTIDPGFSAAPLPEGLNSVVGLPDGSALLVGDSSEFNGSRRVGDRSVARGVFRHLRANGTVDELLETQTFLTGTPQVAALPDGRFLASGVATYFESATSNQSANTNLQAGDLIQFLPNGNVDPGFKVAFAAPTDRVGNEGGNDFISSFWRQADGQWVILGSFTSVNGQPVVGLTRLAANGSRDVSFPSEVPAPNTSFLAGAALPTGGFVALTVELSLFSNPLLRWYDATGRPDLRFPSYLLGSNSRQQLRLAVLSDGTVFVGGTLRSVSGHARFRFAYFTPDGQLGTDQPLAKFPFTASAGGLPGIDFIARASGAAYVLEQSANLSNWVPQPPVSLAPGHQRFTFDPAAANQGFFRVRWQPSGP